MAPAAAGRTLEVRLVGRVAVRTTGGWRDDWPRPAARRLVALLVLSPTRSASREVVADRLFGHLPRARGLRNVSKALSQARAVVGPGVLRGDSATVWIEESLEVRTDLARDSALAHRALTGLAPSDRADLRAVLARADQLLSEDLYEDWAQDLRREHEALTREATLALARGSGLETDWGRVLALDPCHVEAWSQMLTAAAARGPAELGATYERCRLVHAQEAQGPPPPALRRLTDRLRPAPSAPAEVDATVGHLAELRWIRERVGVTAQGGDSWVLYGPAGIGKTHLLRRAVDGLREHGCLVLRATCVADDAGGPLSPLTSALRQSHGDPNPAAGAFDRGGPGGPQGSSPVRLADDVAALLDGYAERLVLVVDDVHWAHPALRSLLSRLCALVGGRRWSLVMAGRSDEADHPLPSVPSTTPALRVSPLSPEETAVLARRVVGHDRAPDPAASEAVVQSLVARSAGNPFFLTELARTAGGAPVSGRDIPERVQSLLRRRLSLVSAPSRHALALLALAGERATVPLLARVLGDQETQRAVCELRSHSLLSPTSSAPRPAHPLLREVVIADQPAVGCAEVHEQLAEALGLLAQESGRADLAEAAAGHVLAAYTAYPSVERAPRAAAAGLEAGRRMLRSFVPDTAATILEQALAALADSPADARSRLLPAAVEGWLDLGRCRLLLGDPEGAEQAVRAGLDLAERPLDRARCYRQLAALHYRSGRMADSAGILELALADTTDELARAVLETELGWTLHRRGRAREALPLLQRATRVFEDGGSWDLAAWALDYLAMTHVALDDPGRGLVLLDRALARDGVGLDHLRRGVIVIHRARVLLLLHRAEEALGAVNEGRRILRRTRDRYALSVGCRVAADVHEALGDLPSAVSARTEEISLLRGTRNTRHLAVAHAHLADLYRRQGRAEECRAAARAARAAVEQAPDGDVARAVSALLEGGNTPGTPGS